MSARPAPESADRPMYATRYAEVYDLLMRERGKDYAGEAAELTRLIRRHNPAAVSLLDVACGSGLHLQHFATLFGRVVGLDDSAEMLHLARQRSAGLRTELGDMRKFHLGASFDAITCLFAVPHLGSVVELEAMLRCCVAHLTPGGVIVVEPWFDQDSFTSGFLATDLVKRTDRVVFRVSHSVRRPGRPDQVRMIVHYVDATPAQGIQLSTETVDLALFGTEQYEMAFARSGCRAEYLPPDSRFRQGLWLARRQPLARPARQSS